MPVGAEPARGGLCRGVVVKSGVERQWPYVGYIFLNMRLSVSEQSTMRLLLS